MRFTQLRALVEVLDRGSFTSAARSLGVTQPAISQQLRSLETELGVRLFRREGRGLIPTAAAKALGERARIVVSSWTSTAELADQLRNQGRRRLLIGASLIPGIYVVPAVLTSFSNRHPEIDIELTIADAQEILRKLRAGAVSIAIVAETGDEEDLLLVPFHRDSLVPIWSPRSPLATLRRVSIADLIAERFVSFAPGDGTRIVFERWLAAEGLEIDLALEVDSLEAVKQSVAANLGVAVISEAAIQLELEADLLRTSDVPGFPIGREIFVAIRRQADVGPAERALMEILLGAERASDRPEP
jgi:DNA-binding transcriptional LysR family regulator